MFALYGMVFTLLHYADCTTGRIQTGRTGLLDGCCGSLYATLGSHVA